MRETAASAFDVVELRRYRTNPGKRDALIALFDREFTENQEACGIVPIGHYRNLDDPDSFVWFRGFARYEARRQALESFYQGSQTWKDHRAEANDAIAESDDALLLRDARPHSGFDLAGLVRPTGTATRVTQFVGVAVLMLGVPPGDALVTAFENELLPRLREHARRNAYFVTDPRPNEYPQQPVRAGEHAFVAAGVCGDREALERWIEIFATANLPMELRAATRCCEILRLVPAARSLYGN